MLCHIDRLCVSFTSVFLLSASLALAQRPPQDRAFDPPAVQEEGTTMDAARQAPQAPQQMNDVDDESPIERGTVIAVAQDGSATVRTAGGVSVQLPPGDWEVGDVVECITRAGTTVCGAE